VTPDRTSPIWVAAYGAMFAAEVSKRKIGKRPKSIRAIAREAAEIRSFCLIVADLAVGDPPPLERDPALDPRLVKTHP